MKNIILIVLYLILLLFTGCSKSKEAFKEVEIFSKSAGVDAQFYKSLLNYYEHYWILLMEIKSLMIMKLKSYEQN